MTPWTVVYKVPPWNFPGKSTTRVGFHFLHVLIVGKTALMGQKLILKRSKKYFVMYKVHSEIYYSTSVVLNLMKGKLMGKMANKTIIRPY